MSPRAVFRPLGPSMGFEKPLWQSCTGLASISSVPLSAIQKHVCAKICIHPSIAKALSMHWLVLSCHLAPLAGVISPSVLQSVHGDVSGGEGNRFPNRNKSLSHPSFPPCPRHFLISLPMTRCTCIIAELVAVGWDVEECACAAASGVNLPPPITFDFADG